MLSNKSGRVMVALMVLAVLAVLTVAMTRPGAVLAQQGGGGGMGGMGGGMMGGGMRGMMPPQPAVVASGDFVYVVMGNMLYKINAKTLALDNKVEFFKPTPPGGQGGPPPPGQ